MKKIYFVLFQEEINGVIKSQVFETISFFEELGFDCVVLMISPLRLFFKTKKLIIGTRLNIIVIPNIRSSLKFPEFLIKILIRPQESDIYIGRGVFAANLITKFKNNKTIYDGRGAYYKEIEEYKLAKDLQRRRIIEKNAVEKTDYQIAITNKLVEYWKKNRFRFDPNRVKVIPTLINSNRLVNKVCVTKDDRIRICFVGSNGKWQGEELLIEFITSQLSKRNDVFFNLLMKKTQNIIDLIDKYPENIQLKYVNFEEVNDAIKCDDYALLLRENNVTNNVAAPTKFAEYLACGLKVIISEGVGDFSDFVRNNDLGFIYHKGKFLDLTKVSKTNKSHQIKFCKNNLTRDSYINKSKYLELLQ